MQKNSYLLASANKLCLELVAMVLSVTPLFFYTQDLGLEGFKVCFQLFVIAQKFFDMGAEL
jgi:hypothetical protein